MWKLQDSSQFSRLKRRDIVEEGQCQCPSVLDGSPRFGHWWGAGIVVGQTTYRPYVIIGVGTREGLGHDRLFLRWELECGARVGAASESLENRRIMSTTASINSKNILNSDVEITGTLKFNGELTFDGKLDGDIASEGTLNLGDNAIVKGNLNVNSVVLRGKINGNVTAKERIEIKAGTELFGDIRSARLAIEEGVTFVGKTEVNPSKVVPLAQPEANGAEDAGAAAQA